MQTFNRNQSRTRVRDVMTPNPLSISETASIRDAAAFLLSKRMGAAPVINEAGRAVGVVSMSDIVRHTVGSEEASPQDMPVRAIMNDEVFFVRPETSIDAVVDDLLRCKVRRMFVADGNGVLVGVISATDVLRHLNAIAATSASKSVNTAGKRTVPRLPGRPTPLAASPQNAAMLFATLRR